MDKKFFKKHAEDKTITIKKDEKTDSGGMKKTYTKNRQSCKVTFALPKEAVDGVKTVNVVGDFNNWDKKANPLKKLRIGTFATTLTLPCGKEYRFKYLIDGSRWENDWHADQYAPSPYGGEDSIVSL
jgi:1,4-alpha-glucan branching enzyme